MRWKGKDGLKFSFGVNPLEQPSSSLSTPKFPSIQFPKDTTHHLTKYPLKPSTERIQFKRSPSEIYRELGGTGIQLMPRQRKLKIKIADKISPFLNDDNSSIQFLQNKSVKSTQSANERRIHQSENKNARNRIQFKQKNFHSLANILQIKGQSPYMKKLEARFTKNKPNIQKLKRNSKSYSKKQSDNQIEFKNIIILPERKQTKKIVNNFFQGAQKNIQFRQTKKEGKSVQKPRFQSRQKSKIFKSYLQKARPTLRVTGRPLNNDRLQTIVRDFDETNNLY